MKAKLPLLLIFLTASQLVLAQKQNYSITIAPAMLNPTAFALQPGFQWKIDNRVSMLTEIAYPVLKGKRDFEKLRLFKLASELKYKLNKDDNSGGYMSLQVATVRRSISADSGRYTKQEYSDFYYLYKSAEIRSPVWFTALKFGVESDVGNNIFFDFFLGAGVRQIKTEYKADVYNTYQEGFKEWFRHVPAWMCECEITRFHTTLGLRIGRRF